MLQTEHDNRKGDDDPEKVNSEPNEPIEPNEPLEPDLDPDLDPEQCLVGQKGKPVMKNDSDRRSIIVCNHYKQHRCKFGLTGRDCPYVHPKLCIRYKTNGLDPVKGCKKGNKCTYFHPPICYGSDRRRECLNLECKRLHLKGTRRYPSTDQQQQQQQQQQQPKQANLAHRPTTVSLSTHPSIYTTREVATLQPPQAQGQQTDSVIFLVQQIQQMQQVQQQIMHALKLVPWQGGFPPTQGPPQQQYPQYLGPTQTPYIK